MKQGKNSVLGYNEINIYLLNTTINSIDFCYAPVLLVRSWNIQKHLALETHQGWKGNF